MAGTDPGEFISDPLTEVTRKERRNLLLASAVGMVVVLMGLIPTRVTALGVDFSTPEQSSFLLILAAIVAYFLTAFSVYATADFFIWRKRVHDYWSAVESANQSWSLEDQEAQDEREAMNGNIPKIEWYYTRAPWLANARGAFEFFVPPALGVVAFVALLVKACLICGHHPSP